MDMRRVYGVMCAAATARRYSGWIQSNSVDKMVVGKWTKNGRVQLLQE